MKLTLSAGLCAPLLAGASLIGGYARAANSLAVVITSAVADPTRPESNRDSARKPAESLHHPHNKYFGPVDIAAFNID